MNLKLVLMQLNNRLVTEYGYGSAHLLSGGLVIDQFTKWIDGNPHAQEILAEIGVEWSMVFVVKDVQDAFVNECEE